MMGKWIDVEGPQLPPVPVEDRPGVYIQLFVSPYDVPQAVRGAFDADQKRFNIELKYMSSEPTEDHQDGDLTLTVGRRSGRIYGVGINVDRFKAESAGLGVAVKHEVDTAMTRLADVPAPTPASGNARAVRATLASTPSIYEELAGAR